MKFIAIFRLILPAALFRLCGGRVENLGELQPLAVKAGLNGVMMGNFLTTLGSEPEDDRRMFEELGLNVARQEDNGANPRPDNRSGWLEGEAPSTPIDDLVDSQAEANFWDPSTQLRFRKKSKPPAYPPRPSRRSAPATPVAGATDSTGGPPGMSDIHDRLEELRELGLYRRMRMVSGPQGPRVLLDGKRVLLLCSNNYLGLADHPQVREAAADAAMRYGVGTGASRLVSGNMTLHRRLEERLAEFKHSERCLLFGSGYLANVGVITALAQEGDVVFSDALNHASIIDGCRLARADTFVYDHLDTDHLEWGLREAGGRGKPDRDRQRVLDGRRHRAARAHRRPRKPLRRAGDGRRGTRDRRPRAGGPGAVAEAGLEGEVDIIVGTLGKALGSYGAYACCDAEMARYLVNAARTLIFSTGPAPPVVAAALTALDLVRENPRRIERVRRNAQTLRDALGDQGLAVPAGETAIVPLLVGDAARAVAVCERALQRGVFAQAIRPPTVPEGSFTAAAGGHVEPQRGRARVGGGADRRGRTRGRRDPVRAGTALGDPVRPRACGVAQPPGCSSPARTPGSGRRSSRARSRPRWPREGSACPSSSPS